MAGAILDVMLGSNAGGARRALVREPNAHAELLPHGTGPVAVTKTIAMLLLEGSSDCLDPADVWGLSLSDRDRIVASIHTHCFGDRIEGLVTCRDCGDQFEMRFSLAEEVLQPTAKRRENACVVRQGQSGSYLLPNGVCFRLPTVDDERKFEGMPSVDVEASLARCCLGPGTDPDLAVSDGASAMLEKAMNDVAPLLDLELPVSCSECSASQRVHFDVVSYFVSCLVRERPILLREVHCLAKTYHWGYDEIMRLPRSLRRAHVELIEIDRGRLRGVS